MSLLTKVFGDPNKKYIDSLLPIVENINSLEKEVEKLSQEELRAKTKQFQEDLKVEKVTLDEILPYAFAMTREAAKRTLNQRHYDVQLISGIVLHQGRIAEMKTGEGKTLASTCPIFLNALTGRGVSLITVNDYLSKRDCVWMGQIYHYLGLSVASIEHETSYVYDENFVDAKDKSEDKSIKVVDDYLRPVTRREAYQADIIYGTNNEFGFDYLRDNMQTDKSEICQRGFYYCIIDEVDSVLIDEARTPLIISSPDVESTNQYQRFASVVDDLQENKHYNIDEKMRSVTFTEEGQNYIAQKLNDDPWAKADFTTVFHLEASLKAKLLFKRDKDYIVKDGEILIVDEFTGRLMPGRRYSEGLHQALEAKEGVKVQKESLTLATVTFQNYFRMYEKLSGMTGTALTEAEEFAKIYSLEVASIPTNKPVARLDLNDRIYKTEIAKFNAIVKEVKERHQKGQPVLIGTISIERNEIIGDLLKREGIPYKLLNAKQHEKEAEIISQAGRLGAVTVATNMAGRGVDIILGGNPYNKEEAQRVKELGGLLVLGTERHESRRIDNQLRGRAGRQGDPGASQFYVSMEDDLMRVFGSDRMKSIMNTLGIPDEMPIENKMISNSIEKAQVRVEGYNFDIRKHLVEYDDVINKQREIIYKKRREILDLSTGIKLEEYETLADYIKSIIKEEISQIVNFHTSLETQSVWNINEIIENIKTIFPISSDEEATIRKMNPFESSEKSNHDEARISLIDYINSLLEEKYAKLRENINNLTGQVEQDGFSQIEKGILLRAIDSLWIDHLDNISHLRTGIGLRGYAQADPLVEYKRESYDLFVELLASLDKQVVYSIFKAGPITGMFREEKKTIKLNDPSENLNKQFELGDESRKEIHNKTTLKNEEVKKFGHKVGRNDDCPCGSGKKYKKCCGKDE